MDARIAAFLDYLGRDRGFSENTISAYRNDLNQLSVWLANPPTEGGLAPVTDVNDLTDEHLRAYADHLGQQKYASSTVARKMAALKSFTNYLHRQGETAAVLGRDIVVPRVKKARPRAISTDEVERLIDTPAKSGPVRPEQQRDRAMLELLYASGLRVSELVSLEVDDIDVERQVIDLDGRRGERRQIPLAERCIPALTKWMEESRGIIANRGETALFVNHRGNRLTRQGFWLILKSHAQRAGITAITPHTLRHSFAAHAIEDGMDLNELQRRLGHVSSVTTQVYQRMHNELNGVQEDDEEDAGINAVLREMAAVEREGAGRPEDATDREHAGIDR